MRGRRERTDNVLLSFRMGKKDNDREIDEWYNDVKLGRQIGIGKEDDFVKKLSEDAEKLSGSTMEIIILMMRIL